MYLSISIIAESKGADESLNLRAGNECDDKKRKAKAEADHLDASRPAKVLVKWECRDPEVRGLMGNDEQLGICRIHETYKDGG